MLGVAILIFLITDPFGNIAVFLAVLRSVSAERRLKVALRELLFALGLLLLFLTLGEHILSGLGLSKEATGIAGGIILFVVAMRLIFPTPQGVLGDMPDNEPLFVPLATPAVAGPSALAMLITLRSTYSGPFMGAVSGGDPGLGGDRFHPDAGGRFLGPRGLMAVERLAGMLLIMLSVNMLLQNVRSFLRIAA